ncbi:MAG: hypothetical protein Q9168_001900 [Polycauliona sp. 1 TL-2023]
MAEAFALAASIIALVNTSRKTAQGIAKLAELRHAPDMFLALNNEVADLQCVIEDLQDLDQKHRDFLHEAITPTYHRTIERTKEVLMSLDKLIAYRLTKRESRVDLPRVDRSTWLRSQRRIDRLLQDIRDCRMRLSNAIGIITAYCKFTEKHQRDD